MKNKIGSTLIIFSFLLLFSGANVTYNINESGYSLTNDEEILQPVYLDNKKLNKEIKDCYSLINLGQEKLSCESGGLPEKCCAYWTNTYEEEIQYVGGYWPRAYPKFSCSTGGQEKCVLGKCSQTEEA